MVEVEVLENFYFAKGKKLFVSLERYEELLKKGIVKKVEEPVKEKQTIKNDKK